MSDEDKLRGFDLGNGLLLAPHYGTDEDEAINYEPVTPENVYLKLRAIREFCLKLEEDNEFVNSAWAGGHIMCILKYGDGFQQDQIPDWRSRPTSSPKRPWWRFWP